MMPSRLWYVLASNGSENLLYYRSSVDSLPNERRTTLNIFIMLFCFCFSLSSLCFALLMKREAVGVPQGQVIKRKLNPIVAAGRALRLTDIFNTLWVSDIVACLFCFGFCGRPQKPDSD